MIVIIGYCTVWTQTFNYLHHNFNTFKRCNYNITLHEVHFRSSPTTLRNLMDVLPTSAWLRL